MSNNSSEIEAYSQTQSSHGKLWSIVFCSIITALIILGNLLVIVAFISRPSLRQVRSNIFIFSLAVTDLLVGLIVAPLNTEFHFFDNVWHHGPQACFLWVFSDTVACTASIWTLAAIAADRMTAVVYPVNYMTFRRLSAVLVVVGVWILSVLVCIPAMLEITYEHCAFHPEIWILVLASMGAFYVPLGFITVCYVVIFIRLKSKMKRRTDRQKAQNIEMKIRRPNGKRFSKDDIFLNGSRKTSATALMSMSPSTPDLQLYWANSTIQQENPRWAPGSNRLPAEVNAPGNNRLIFDMPDRSAGNNRLAIEAVDSFKLATANSRCATASVDNLRVAVDKSRLAGESGRAALPRATDKKRQFKKDVLSLGIRSSAILASQQREKRVLIQMSVLVLVFLICWLPFWVHFSIVTPLCHLYQMCQYPVWIDFGIQWLAYCNSLINPVLYTIFNPEFRIAFKEILTGSFLSKCHN